MSMSNIKKHYRNKVIIIITGETETYKDRDKETKKMTYTKRDWQRNREKSHKERQTQRDRETNTD